MNSRQMSLCGLLTALAVALLALGGLVPAATFCAPMLAMVALLPILEELGPRAAGTACAATALLGLLLVADRETAFVYLFFGWYPILRPKIAALPSRLLRLAARLAVCSLTVFLLYGPALRVLGLPVESAEISRLLNGLLLLMGNGIFLLLDLCLARMSALWRQKLRRRFFH